MPLPRDHVEAEYVSELKMLRMSFQHVQNALIDLQPRTNNLLAYKIS